MRKRAISILSTLGMLVTLGVTAIHAGSRDAMRADIPFSFVVGSRILPAGRYRVSQAGPDSVIKLSAEETGQSVFTPITIPIRSGMDQHRTELQFHRYGDAYFLSQVWVSTDGEGCELPKTKLERELVKSRPDHLAKAGQEPEIVTIAAR